VSFLFKRENDVFKWESDFMVLEFSNPSIQGFSEHVQLTSHTDILHYYYSVKIYKKTHEWDEDGSQSTEQELVCERDTYDFPRILDLKEIVGFQLNDNTVMNGQKNEYTFGDARYSKVLSTDGFACDDFYEVSKSVNADGGEERYTVYCGTTFDAQGDLNSVGLRTPYVKREDLEQLLKCVNEFIQYSLTIQNEQIQLWNARYGIENGKIYEYEIIEKGINKGVIESIYAVGDKLNITTVIDNKEVEYKDVIINKIEEEYIILSDGERLPVESICYVNYEPSSAALRYKEDEITEEFLAILSDAEKEEFKNSSTVSLLNRYKQAIIDRTWMCRSEHEFDIDYQTGDMVNTVTPVVEVIIRKIKNRLREYN
jgi:hypothetical protein